MCQSGSWKKHVWRLTSLVAAVAMVLGVVLPAHPASAAGLDDLQAYAEQMKPIHESAIDIAREDATIFREARSGNPDALCDGRLAANGEEMANLRAQMAAIQPPEEATQLHTRLIASLDDYAKGIRTVANFCETGDKVKLVRAALAVTSARLKYGTSIIEYNLLLLESGLEEFQVGYEGSDFQALLEYGADIGPAYRGWADLIAAEGPAIDVAVDGHPEELCNKDIASDAPLMQEILDDFGGVAAPDAATNVHQTVVIGAQAWLQALGHSGDYCTAEKHWQKAIYLGAAVGEFGGGAVGPRRRS